MKHSLSDTLAVFGNDNHVPNFISQFEREIEVRNEPTKVLADAPNYFAWLCLTSEYAYYMVKRMLFLRKDGGDSTVFNLPYKTLLDRLFEVAAVSVELRDDILLFARIRHLIVHKGFPNPHDEPAADERELAGGVVYSKRDVWEVCKRLRSPSTYPDLKSAFVRVRQGIQALQGNVSFQY